MVHKRLLACLVTEVHATNLRQRDVAFVYHHQPVILGMSGHATEVIHQCPRALSTRTAIKEATVVFNTAAVAGLLDHLQVILSATDESLRLQQFAFRAQLQDALVKLCFDFIKRALHPIFRHHVVHSGEHPCARFFAENFATDRIECFN